MAKISARGATKIAEVREDGYVWVLCSDGRVLRRWGQDGYTLLGKVKKIASDPQVQLERIVHR